MNPAPAPARNPRRTIGRAAIVLATVFIIWLPAGILDIVPFVFSLPGESGLRSHAGAAVARTDLAPEGSEEGARSVDVQINRLRQKIEDDPSNPLHLQTVRGAGYVLHID